MSIKLSGSLNYFPLIEILDLLVSEKETGNLSIELKDKIGGIYLETGKIVHAYYKNLFRGKEAFFKLFTIAEGNFYLRQEEVSDRTIEGDTKTLLDELGEKIVLWDEIRKIVPSEDMYFKLTPVPREFKQNKILLSREQWLVLTRLDGSRSVAEISEELNMEILEISEILVNFFKLGFIQPLDIYETREVEKQDRTIDASIFSGSLKSFSLMRLIEFINLLGLSGKLKLLRGIYQGKVFIKEGELIHGTNNIWEGELALIDLLSWAKGRFTFIPMVPEKLIRTINTPVEEIILTCGENLNKWRKIQGTITSPELIFAAKITDQEKNDEEELTFSRRQWKVLYNIDGSTSIRRLGEKLKLNNAEIAEAIYLLYREGLVEPTNLSDFELPSSRKEENVKEDNDDEEQEGEEAFFGTTDDRVLEAKEKYLYSPGNYRSHCDNIEGVMKEEKDINTIKSKFDDLISLMENGKKAEPDDTGSTFFDR